MKQSVSAWDDTSILKLILSQTIKGSSLDGIPEKISPDEGTYRFYVEFSTSDLLDAYAPWEIYADCDWIHFDKDKGTEDERITMTVDAYSGDTPRFATVVLKLAGADDSEQFMRCEALVQQDGVQVFPAEYDVYYALPGVNSTANHYNDQWKNDPYTYSITFKTNFKVSECFLDDDAIEYSIKDYNDIYPDDDGYYENKIVLTIAPQVPVIENYGHSILRTSSPIPSRRASLFVRLPGAPGENKKMKVSEIVQVGLPCITMKYYQLNNVSVNYDVSMEGMFNLDFEVSYPDELTRSACKTLGFRWSSNDYYGVENKDLNLASLGYGGTMLFPLSESSLPLTFFQFPLTSRTFDWTIDMFVEFYDSGSSYEKERRIYAAYPARITHTF